MKDQSKLGDFSENENFSAPTSSSSKSITKSSLIVEKQGLNWAKRWRLSLIFILVLCSGLSIGLASRLMKTPKSESDVSVNVLPVRTKEVKEVNSYEESQLYTGEVEAFRTSELGFERSGKLVSVNVEEGDVVTEGRFLAKIDTSNLEAQLNELLAQKAKASALLAELKVGPRTERIAAARSSVNEVKEQLALEQLRRSRREDLYAEGAISREQLDEIVFNSNALSERLETEKSELNELLNGTRTEQIEAQEAEVRQLEARIVDVEVSIAKSNLVAPFSGTVGVRYLDEGTVVDSGQSVVRLVEESGLKVRVGVSELIASQLQSGSWQTVNIGNNTYEAKVLSILPEVNLATRTRTVVLALESSAQGEVVPGQTARLAVNQTVEKKGYWLPLTALAKGDRGLWSCYALKEIKQDKIADEERKKLYQIEKKDIEILHNHTDGQQVLVRGTLREGDSVIINSNRVVAGQIVQKE